MNWMSDVMCVMYIIYNMYALPMSLCRGFAGRSPSTPQTSLSSPEPLLSLSTVWSSSNPTSSRGSPFTGWWTGRVRSSTPQRTRRYDGHFTKTVGQTLGLLKSCVEEEWGKSGLTCVIYSCRFFQLGILTMLHIGSSKIYKFIIHCSSTVCFTASNITVQYISLYSLAIVSTCIWFNEHLYCTDRDLL